MKKIISLLAALMIISSNGISTFAEDDIYVWARETEPAETEVSEITEDTETEVTTTVTTTITTTEAPESQPEKPADTLDPEKEALKKQIEDLQGQLEKYGMSMSDLTMTIDELKAKLAAATRIPENANKSNGSSGGGGGGSLASTPAVTQVVTTEAVPQTQGNANLIEEVKAKNDERQFITVSAKDGSVFYIVIDYSGGDENVYFLNKVDIADLNAIAYPDGKVPAVTEPVKEKKIESEPVVTEPVKQKKENSNATLYIIIAVIGTLVVLGYYFIKIKPNKSGGSNDFDDDDYTQSDDYANEVEIDEDKEY